MRVKYKDCTYLIFISLKTKTIKWLCHRFESRIDDPSSETFGHKSEDLISVRSETSYKRTY